MDEEKAEMIARGETPFFEPGLNDLLKLSIEKRFFKVSKDPLETVLNTDVTFITVGTPGREDGSIDLTYVKEASHDIGRALRLKESWHLVVVKSTVTPTTTRSIVKPTIEEASGKPHGSSFGICVNPEFLREGSAVEDTFKPDRVVIGELDSKSGDELEAIYREFYGVNMPPILRTTPSNAELIKYASNAFLAMKVSFINTIANLCERIPEADVSKVAEGMGMDRRVGSLFLKAGLGFGGSCLPKDLKALGAFSKSLGVEPPLVEATLKVNEAQPLKAVEMAEELAGSLGGKQVAILGTSFKPDTDDVREAPSLKIIKLLLEKGADVAAYDPASLNNVRKIFGNRITYAPSAKACLKDADVAIVVTEWEEFKELKPEDFKELMKRPLVVDGRRVFKVQEFKDKNVAIKAMGFGPLTSLPPKP